MVGLAIASPDVFALDADSQLRPTLARLRESGIDRARLVRLVLSHPEVLEGGGVRLDSARAFLEGLGVAEAKVAPPPPRTKWTRRVPHPVLIGHAASLTPY